MSKTAKELSGLQLATTYPTLARTRAHPQRNLYESGSGTPKMLSLIMIKYQVEHRIRQQTSNQGVSSLNPLGSKN